MSSHSTMRMRAAPKPVWGRELLERSEEVAALVRGEGGVGKTALVRRWCDEQDSARVLWGACDALFTPRPLGPFLDIAQQTKGARLTAVNSGTNRDEVFTSALDD